jgi:hypothetical protein
LKKRDGNSKCGPEIVNVGAEFHNFRPAFQKAGLLFRISGPLFQLRDNFCQSGPEIVNFRLAFEKAVRKIAISV